MAFHPGGFYTFADGGSLTYTAATDPATGEAITAHGVYAPSGTFYALHGLDPTGTWRLSLDATSLDYSGGYEDPDGQGRLYEWVLAFETAPPPSPPPVKPTAAKTCTTSYAGPALRIPDPPYFSDEGGAPFDTHVYLTG
ncbi:hypothetical protein GPECTOR_414g264 [Gonium pectorale]|uniref:P/Homo B domain-containing protein n=1 Tax=Gonium pectorale TaxID=33097 RepID=A0A150FV98_GONPE|nr:hypothetical protein GPECTOR_414g264 [Gonium pectorale]|eukprot:KXZ41527.1 hypothetical protein GPECTOR_414g264 [Gonium pectorale]